MLSTHCILGLHCQRSQEFGDEMFAQSKPAQYGTLPPSNGGSAEVDETPTALAGSFHSDSKVCV